MGSKTVVKRQNIASIDGSKDILARYKKPENGLMHQIMTEDITLIYSTDLNPSWCPNNRYKMVKSTPKNQIATF